MKNECKIQLFYLIEKSLITDMSLHYPKISYNCSKEEESQKFIECIICSIQYL